MRRVLVVPAAGVGSRLGGGVPKALVPVGGRPMLDRLIALYAPFAFRVVVVVRPEAADRVQRLVEAGTVPVALVTQAEPTGMLDAILLARPRVEEAAPDRVWITWCDQVAIRPATIERLAGIEAVAPEPALVMPTSAGERPYIHFTRDAGGRIQGVLQRREGDAMPPAGEGDIGLFSLSARAYLEDLPRFATTVEPGAATRERNFLPFIPWIARSGEVVTFPCTAPIEAVGINTAADLAEVERWLASARQE